MNENKIEIGKLVYYAQVNMADPYTITATPDMLASEYALQIKPAWPGSSNHPVVQVHAGLVYDNYADCQDYAATRLENLLAGAKNMLGAMKNDGLQYLATSAGIAVVPRAEAERMISEYMEGQNA